jgi:predicted GNAT superfamily acetyltransferase
MEEGEMEEQWTFDNFRSILNQAIEDGRKNGLKIDEILAAFDITAKNLQIQYEIAVVELINEGRQKQFMENLDDESTIISDNEGC